MEAFGVRDNRAMKQNSRSIQGLVEEFLDRLTREKGCSVNTVRAYRIDLIQFCDFLVSKGKIQDHGSPLGSAAVDPLVIRAYMAELFKEREKTTIARKLSALRSFFSFLERLRVVEGNPAAEVSTPRLKKYIPAHLTVDQTFRLLGIPKKNSVQGMRDAAILEVLYSCGLRVSELSNLDVEDVDFDNRIIRVMGKGNKERLVPIGKQAIGVLKDYLEASSNLRKKGKSKGAPLFLNYRGGRLTARSIARIIKKYALECGLSSDISPHAMRHTFATHMLDGGADLRAVQELLGHESLSTTQKYTHLTLDKLMEVYDKAHPRSE